MARYVGTSPFAASRIKTRMANLKPNALYTFVAPKLPEPTCRKSIFLNFEINKANEMDDKTYEPSIKLVIIK